MSGRKHVGDQVVLKPRENINSLPVWLSSRHLFRHYLSFLVCIFLVCHVGCVGFVLPTPEHTILEGRGEVDESETDFLTVGKTTSEEVLLRFGEPDLVLLDENILIYHWSVSHGYWLVGGYGGGGGGGAIPKVYLFMLEFDEEGYLKRFEIGGSIWASEESRITKWSKPLGEKLFSKNNEIIIIDPIPKINSQPGLFDTSNKPVRFWIGKFHNLQADPKTDNLIGHKKIASGEIIADVLTTRPGVEIVRTAVSYQLEALGYQFTSNDADVTISGEVAEFGMTVSEGLSTWDSVGSLNVIMEVQPAVEPKSKIIRRYKAKHVLKSRSPPPKFALEQVMCKCLEDMQRQMSSDMEMTKLLGEITR